MKKLGLGLCGLLMVGILAGYGVSWFLQQDQPPAERIPIVVEEALPAWEVQLYFTDPQGLFLQQEVRQIPGCDDDRDCIRSLLEELRSGSRQGLLPVLPKQTGILDIEVENDLVRVNFSKHLVDFHPGGSLSELLTVYSLANSLHENFSYLRQLQILIDGELRQTLKGHVRIGQPVYADFSLSRPPLTGPLPESTIDEQSESAEETEDEQISPGH
ncbi:MAG: hypothetical protein GQ578_04110 [Desulfuromonadaceae bacterium]|nr:hypothetical protein [Desulfuromonadaceae bacterium]